MTTKTKTKKLHVMPWYDYRRLFSFNAMINMIVGGRGIGKTFGAKKLCINNFLKKGEQFIYLRRYKEEMSASRGTFFNDIGEQFPNHVFRVHGSEMQIADAPEDIEGKDGELMEGKPEWKTMGYFAVLANAQSKKGVSYHEVRTIIFDEFIIEKGLIQYLPEEHVALLNFYSTVDRNRDEAKILMLANSVSMSNPYFSEWGIRPDIAGEWNKYGGGYIVVNFPDSKEFQDEVYKTRFGRFIQDSEYAKYAVGNSFADAHGQLVMKKTPKAVPRYNLELANITVSVWKDNDMGVYFVLGKQIAGNAIMYTTVRERMGGGKRYLEPNARQLQWLRSAYNNEKVYFDEPRTREAFIHATRRR